MFECVESSFSFNRGLGQGSVEAPKLWQMMATQLLATVEKKRKMGLLLDFKGDEAHQICSFMWTHNFWIVYHSRKKLEAMLRDLFVEATRWDLAPKLAGL